VEAVCALGCEVVGAYIGALQCGEQHPEYAHLTDRQRTELLAELQAIMAVYRA